MKSFPLIVLLVACVANADVPGERRGVLRRVTRQALGNMGGVFLVQTEKNIISNCERNGLTFEGKTKLQATYDAMKSCMSSTRIFDVPKSEYIDKMVSCSSEAIEQTKACLASSQKYFPEFILDLAKSLVSFMYDDKAIMASRDIPRCMNNFAQRTVQETYFKCMLSVAIKTHDDENIPNSKKDFCDKFLPAGECFPETLNQYCDKTPNVLKFFKDYKHALEAPCEMKEN